MPQHRTGWGLGVALSGLWSWTLAPFVAGVVYLLVESSEAALAERLLKRSGDATADDVDE